MRVKIHRGTAEIGGNCVEVAADDGQRIVIDLGRPLWASWSEEVALPDVPGLRTDDSSLCGILISHPHLDHYGLLSQVRGSAPIFMGAEAASLLNAASFFSPVSATVNPQGFFADRSTMTIGPFTVTAFLNDHSAFDAYSLVIEADGRRIFYTGDIRGHGRKHKLFKALLSKPPTHIDVMLMEGTHVRADPAHDADTFDTEGELEGQFVDLMKVTAGAVAVLGSAQNLDRLVTVYRAARRSGRQLVIDLYGTSVAAATRSTIPQLGFADLRVYVPQRQRVLVKQSGEFNRVSELGTRRVFAEELRRDRGKFAFYVPSSVVPELVKSTVLDASGGAAWSLWDGYLKDASGIKLLRLLADNGIVMSKMHTSGHASVLDLQRLVHAIAPTRVVPMHSSAAGRFVELFPRVETHHDHEWWEV